EHRVEQRPQMAVANGADELAHVVLELLGAARRAVEELTGRELVLPRRSQLAHGQLRPVFGVYREPAADQRGAAARRLTCELGGAVVDAFVSTGWRVVVPWIARKELERLPARDGLELIEADLFDSDSVAEVVGAAAGEAGAALGAVVNLVGGFAAGPRVHETP